MARQVLCCQLALYHHLRGNARVVGAGLPECVTALHSAETNQRIHDGVIETMPHVQAAGDVRRRQGNGVRLARTLGRKVIFSFPLGVPAGFNVVGLVGLVHARRALFGSLTESGGVYRHPRSAGKTRKWG